MLRRLAVVAALSLTGLLGAAGLANAAPDPYPPVTPTQTTTENPPVGASLSADAASVVVGGSVTIAGSGFAPGEVSIVSSVGSGLRAPGVALLSAVSTTTTADSSGSFSATLTLTDLGLNTITATDSAGHSASVSVLVVAASSGSGGTGGDNGGNLPYTGVDGTAITLGVTGGVLAVLLGVGLVWLGKTRRRKGLDLTA